MFGKIFASVGIGSSKVDTILESNEVVLGNPLDGYILIEGGSVEQKIDGINFELLTKIETKLNGNEIKISKTISKGRLLESFTIQPNEKKKIEFHINIPYHTPLSINSTFPIWLKTSLDIDNAIDPSDEDYLKILPSEVILDCVNIVESLGFYSSEVDIEESKLFKWGYVQEFEFKPKVNHFGVNEIELIFQESENQIVVLVIKDKKSFLGDILDLNDSYYKFILDKNSYSLEQIKDYFLEILE
jgi:sporulation-control protein